MNLIVITAVCAIIKFMSLTAKMLGGNLHIHNGEKFVRQTRKNVAAAASLKGYPVSGEDGRLKTKREILASLNFANEAFTTVSGNSYDAGELLPG